MSGAEVDSAALPVGASVEAVEDLRSGRLDGPLYRVVAAQGALRDVRRIEATTGALDGIEARFLAAELRPVRPSVARRYEALRTRRVLAQWRHAAATDAEDFGIVEDLADVATQIGFAGVMSGPLVRSSYRAGRLYQQAMQARQVAGEAAPAGTATVDEPE